MSRKTKILRIEEEGRDKGKSYLLREMSAMRTEEWALEALLALGRAGVEVSDEAAQAGAAAILAAGLGAFKSLHIEDARPLLETMMGCVSFVPDVQKIDPVAELPFSRPIIEDDIEEVGTLLKIRGAVLELHLGFSIAAGLSMLAAAAPSRPSPTRTSRKSSARSSGKGSPRSTNSKRSTG